MALVVNDRIRIYIPMSENAPTIKLGIRDRVNRRTRKLLGCTHRICYYKRRVRVPTNKDPRVKTLGSSWGKILSSSDPD